eukprot:2701732-Rhodomonas_salina.1
MRPWKLLAKADQWESEMRTRRQAPIGVALLSLAIYAATRYRGVPGGDSGELMSMACAGGVPHPPGYPILTMLGRSWLAVTPSIMGSPASRLSLLSCILGSLSATFFFLAARLSSSSSSSSLSSGSWESVLATSFYAFSPLTWTYSTQFEVFSLNNLLSSCILYFSIRYFKHNEAWIPFLGAFLCGLSLCNQHTIALLLIPLVPGVIVQSEGTLLKPFSLFTLVLLFAAGLLPYVYLPLVSASPPLGSWGGQDTWEGFFRHLFRKEYGTFQLYTTGSPTGDAEVAFDALSNLRRQTLMFLRNFSTEAMYGAPILCAMGVAELMRERSALAVLLLSSLLIYLIVFHSLANLPEDDFYRPILSRFWMQPLQLAFLFLAPGLRFVFRIMEKSSD